MSRKLVAVLSAVFVFCTIAGSAVADSTGGLLVTLDALGRRFEARVEDRQAVKYVLRFVAGRAAPEPITVKLANGRNLRVNARIISAKDCRSGQCIALKGLYAGRSPY